MLCGFISVCITGHGYQNAASDEKPAQSSITCKDSCITSPGNCQSWEYNHEQRTCLHFDRDPIHLTHRIKSDQFVMGARDCIFSKSISPNIHCHLCQNIQF